MESQNYWNKRGEKSYAYKGESFYTITPIPFYYNRRSILLKALKNEIEKANTIYDFGCGDGWYLNYFQKLYPEKLLSGFDISETFIEKTRLVLPDSIQLYCGKTDTNNKEYDLIYSIAVFAHISDNEIHSVFERLSNNVKMGGGKLILFEQTSGGVSAIQGTTYIRRLATEYEEIALKAGFRLKMKFSIDFTVHRFFERYIAKKLYALFKGDTQTEQRINANKNILFRALSNIACMLSPNPIKIKNKNYWGNTFFVFEKI